MSVVDLLGDTTEFKGGCCGVRVHAPDKRKASNYLIELMIEDDGYWFVKNYAIDSAWIDDLMEQLKSAKTFIQRDKLKRKAKARASMAQR
jgi:hypothetical protein